MGDQLSAKIARIEARFGNRCCKCGERLVGGAISGWTRTRRGREGQGEGKRRGAEGQVDGREGFRGGRCIAVNREANEASKPGRTGRILWHACGKGTSVNAGDQTPPVLGFREGNSSERVRDKSARTGLARFTHHRHFARCFSPLPPCHSPFPHCLFLFLPFSVIRG